MLLLMLVLESVKIAPRTACDENVAVNLHHFLCRYSSARVQIVHVLRNEKELVCVVGKSCNCFVRGVWLRIADPLPTLEIPVPN
jgi:hypothetical protein